MVNHIMVHFTLCHNGTKMTGVKHTGNDMIIYDTPQESRTSRGMMSQQLLSQQFLQHRYRQMFPTPLQRVNLIQVVSTQTDPVDTSSQQTTGQSYTPPPSSPPSGGGSSGSGGGSSGGGGYGGGY